MFSIVQWVSWGFSWFYLIKYFWLFLFEFDVRIYNSTEFILKFPFGLHFPETSEMDGTIFSHQHNQTVHLFRASSRFTVQKMYHD